MYRNTFFMPLQIEPGYKPHSVQGSECSDFPSVTDLSIVREDRSGAFCDRERKCDYHDKTSFASCITRPVNSMLFIIKELQIFVRQVLNSAGTMKINCMETTLSVGQNET